MSNGEYTDRLRAFEVLYATDSLRTKEPDLNGLSGRSRHMVLGVLEHLVSIDSVLDDAAIGWTVQRMPIVDRNILRLAAHELMYSHISPAIVINEAVELAKEYSTTGSGKFVNGVLDSVSKTVRDPNWVDPASTQDQDPEPTSPDPGQPHPPPTEIKDFTNPTP